jgi:hypothetical protein
VQKQSGAKPGEPRSAGHGNRCHAAALTAAGRVAERGGFAQSAPARAKPRARGGRRTGFLRRAEGADQALTQRGAGVACAQPRESRCNDLRPMLRFPPDVRALNPPKL